MEIIVILGIVIAIYLAWDTLDLRRRGGFTARDVRGGAKLFAALAVVAAILLGALWGLAAVVALWPFWLLVAALTSAWWGVGKLWGRRDAAPTGELYGKVATARAQGREEPWMRGVNVPREYQAQPPPKGGGWLDWLDRL